MARISTSATHTSTYITCIWSSSTMQHRTLDIRLPSGSYASNTHSRQLITNVLHLQQLNTRKTLWIFTYDEIEEYQGSVHPGSQVLSPEYDMDAYMITLFWRWGFGLALRVGSNWKGLIWWVHKSDEVALATKLQGVFFSNSWIGSSNRAMDFQEKTWWNWEDLFNGSLRLKIWDFASMLGFANMNGTWDPMWTGPKKDGISLKQKNS